MHTHIFQSHCSVVTPTQISYSDNTQLSEGVMLTNVSQLGPAVDVSFLIRNSGPSRVPSIDLEILWPLSSTLTGENYYLYITSVQVANSVIMLMYTLSHSFSCV